MRKYSRTHPKGWLTTAIITTLLLALLLPVSMIALAESPAPTIQSDKTDYAPGELVKLTGQNWQGDSKVYVVVNASNGNSWTHTRTVNVAGDGTIRDVFKLPDYFVDIYNVTATGSTTQRVAETSFTDASIGTYDQCANDTGTGYTTGDTGCRWINGNLNPSNSYYVEGDASVQRLWLTGFEPGTTHTVTFHVGTTQSGTHAYDFLTTWDWSESWITLTDRCETITGCLTAPETRINIPNDPNVPDTIEPTASGDRQFVMRGGTLTSVSIPFIAHGTYATNSDTEITVSFTVASSGSLCPTTGPNGGTCGVVLWFGAHVGVSAEWQLHDGTIGAGNISGSPYHVALEMVDGASVGNRDNQMQTSASNGTVVIIKDAVPNDAQDFSFNLNNNSTSDFNFLLDDDGPSGLSNSQSFSLPPGTWTASELNIPAGWILSGLTCVDPTNNTVVTLATGQASINLATNETVTCTFTNTRAGTITVAKITSPPGSTQSFVFDPSWSITNFSLTHGQSHSSGPLVPGTYSVGEIVPAGWQLQGAACSDNSPVSAISLSAGENITCTFTNLFVSNPALNVAKSSTTTTITAAGQVVPYTFVVTNVGNVPLTGVTVSDPNCTSAITGPTGDTNGDSILQLTETWTYACTHTVTQAEINGGTSLSNTVTADSNESPTDTSTYNIPITRSPALTLAKTATPTTYDAVGDVISYSYLLTNSGNVTLTSPFTVTDNKTTVTCPATASLAPGASITCTASYTITQADLTAGSVTNTAAGHGLFGNTPVNSNTDTETVNAVVAPALTLAKTATPTTYDAVGDVISYSYLLTNSGDVTLTSPFTVTDNKATATCPATPTSLAPGASITCSASYTITLADLNAGSVTNTATGHGFFGSTPVNSNTDTETVNAVLGPALTLVKTATPPTYDAVGDVISYSYLLTNSGNVTLTSPFTVTDNKATATCPATPTSLAPGASITCSASYTITQADLDAGSVTNVATGQGFSGTTPVVSNTDSETVNAVQTPALTLVKTATPNVFDSIGDVISYSYVLTNSGNVTLSGPFTVTDDKATVTCPATTSLAPLASITCNASYTITVVDFGVGTVTNLATGHGFFGSIPVNSNTDTETVSVMANADVAIVKTVSTATAVPGQTLSYTLVVTNNGPSTAIGVMVSDTLPAGLTFVSAVPAPTSGPSPLVWNLGNLTIGQAATITVQATVTATSGSLTNTATVTTTTIDPNTNNNTSTTTTTVLTPGITVQKTVSIGQVVRNMPFTYTIRIENTGQVPLTPVEVTDTLPAGFHFIVGSATPQQPDLVAEPILTWNDVGPLGVGQAITISFNVTAAPGATGTYINTVDVIGSYNCIGQAVTCGSVSGTATASVAVADPVVDVVKSLIDADLDAIAPNYITFTVDVSNPGISVIDILPLLDTFDSSVLRFVSASVPPNTSTAVGSAGALTWTDLTGPTNGFNANLAPGQHFLITTVFEVIADITTTTNTVTVSNSIDVLNNIAAEVTDAVTVTNVPTAVTSKYFKATKTGSQTIRLEWATAAEVYISGFKVYRALVNDFSQAASIGYKSASGSSSVYALNDQLPSYGRWYYWLVAVDMDGNEEVITQTDVIDYQFQVFVPMVRR